MTDTQTQLSRRRATKAAFALAAAATTPSGVASAHHNGVSSSNSSSSGLFSGDVIDDTADVLSLAAAAQRGAKTSFTQSFFGDLSDAEETAIEVMTHLNDNSSEYRRYINDRNLGGSDREVMELQIRQESDTSILYVVGEYDGDEYTSLETLDEDAYDDQHSGRGVDERTILTGMAASNAPDELEEFHSEFVEPNEDVTHEYATEMYWQYRGGSNHASSTLLGDDL